MTRQTEVDVMDLQRLMQQVFQTLSAQQSAIAAIMERIDGIEGVVDNAQIEGDDIRPVRNGKIQTKKTHR